jgi:hypothetical protein
MDIIDTRCLQLLLHLNLRAVGVAIHLWRAHTQITFNTLISRAQIDDVSIAVLTLHGCLNADQDRLKTNTRNIEKHLLFVVITVTVDRVHSR